MPCESTNTYWTGPYGVLVPIYISSVIATDGYNTINSNGVQTELYCSGILIPEQQYQKLYANYDPIKMAWIYVGDKINYNYLPIE